MSLHQAGFQRLDHDPEYAVLILKNVVVPEAEHAPAPASQESIAPIVFTRHRVLTAIGFDDELGFDAGKIDKIRWDRELPTKSGAKMIAPEKIPQATLCIGWQSAQ